ncbi:MAG: EamA family transporter RarD [Ignavibacteriales bacterium]|nr:EamA family transporter RarD [Ignavibacteriales bacterium]
MNKGMRYAVGAYISWGVLPIYWKWLHHVPALQLISHRILWSFFALVVVILLTRRWKEFRQAVFTPRVLRVYSAAALLIGINWLTYVWAVNAGHIIETSLGYFINPLLSVLMGVIFLHEHVRPRQWIPLGLAGAGVLYLTFAYGSLPWIALTLAVSFGVYGLVKKIAPLGSLYGLTLETGILLIPAFVYLLYSDMHGSGSFLHTGTSSDFLMIGAGLVTTIPLLMFASAAQRISLSLVGILQYIAPTLQFLVGVIIYKEPFTHIQFIGYGVVWVALFLFAVEGYLAYRSKPVAAAEGIEQDLL